MSPNWTLIIQAIGVLIAAVGFPLIFLQVRVTRQQAELATRATRSNLYSHVSEAMDRVNSRLMQNLALVPYFYENRSIPETNAEVEVMREANLLCETIMDMVDSIVEQQRARPEDMDWSTWHVYFRWLHNHAPILRRFLDDNTDFYPDYVYWALGRINVRDPDRGHILESYQAYEYAPPGHDADAYELQRRLTFAGTPPETGFPWVRVWLFYRLRDSETKDPVVVADVGTRHYKAAEDAATVHILQGSVDDASMVAIRDWILRTFERTGVRWVSFRADNTHPSAADDIDLKREYRALYGPRAFAPDPVKASSRRALSTRVPKDKRRYQAWLEERQGATPTRP